MLLRRNVPQQAVVHADVDLAAHDNVRVPVRQVGEQVEGEDDGAVARVLEGHHAAEGAPGLDRREDVFDGDLRQEIVLGLVECVEGRLSGSISNVIAPVMIGLCHDAADGQLFAVHSKTRTMTTCAAPTNHPIARGRTWCV